MMRLARPFLTLCLALAWAGAAWAQDTPSGTVVYGIHHEKHGDIGTHKVSFSRSGEDLLVEVEGQAKVKVLFFTVYRMETSRREIWHGGRLVSYRAQTNDDGEDIAVEANTAGDKLVIEGQKGRVEAPAGTFPTHPWNHEIVEQSLLMDTKTGNLLKVAISEAGEEAIQVRGAEVKAKKYVISGDMERELWFGPDGAWLKMRYEKDGAKITLTLM